MGNLIYLLKLAWVDLGRNKVRTGLTSLGIFVGVLSVVLLLALGVGFRNFISEQFESLGTNVIAVFPGAIFSDEGGFRDTEGGVGQITFTQRDVDQLRRRVKGADLVVPIFISSFSVEGGGNSEFASLFATTTDIFPLRKYEADYGRFFTDADVGKGAKVVVLGPKIAEDLFGKAKNGVGKTVRMDEARFTVVGILNAKSGGGLGGPDFDSFVYMPYTAAYVFNPDKTFSGIYLQARSEDVVDEVKQETTEILLRRYDDDQFSVIEQAEILQTVTGIFAAVNSVLVAIGAISLLVGGIGIMNIMYASVTERVKEVGIRRAIGATEGDILQQFLSESVVLSLVGGLLALGVAAVVVLIVRQWFPAAIEMSSVLLALGVSSGIGVFFGVFPARKAAKLPPIEAIKK